MCCVCVHEQVHGGREPWIICICIENISCSISRGCVFFLFAQKLPRYHKPMFYFSFVQMQLEFTSDAAMQCGKTEAQDDYWKIKREKNDSV